MNIKKLEQMIETMRGIPPANWLLMAPDGRIWKGADPIVLVTQAVRKVVPAGIESTGKPESSRKVNYDWLVTENAPAGDVGKALIRSLDSLSKVIESPKEPE